MKNLDKKEKKDLIAYCIVGCLLLAYGLYATVTKGFGWDSAFILAGIISFVIAFLSSTKIQ